MRICNRFEEILSGKAPGVSWKTLDDDSIPPLLGGDLLVSDPFRTTVSQNPSP